MPQVLELDSNSPRVSKVSDRSQKLKQISDGASEIRRKLLNGDITEQQAADELIKLKREYSSFFDRLFS